MIDHNTSYLLICRDVSYILLICWFFWEMFFLSLVITDTNLTLFDIRVAILDFFGWCFYDTSFSILLLSLFLCHIYGISCLNSRGLGFAYVISLTIFVFQSNYLVYLIMHLNFKLPSCCVFCICCIFVHVLLSCLFKKPIKYFLLFHFPLH